MWLVFDQLWSAPAAVQMRKTFISNLRLVAQFAREPVSKDLNTALPRSLALRETISTNLDKVRSLADGVLFEFGASRAENLALRDRIRQWQLNLRILFILKIATWKYRAQLAGFELPQAVADAQREFDDDLAGALSAIADRMEGRPAEKQSSLDNPLARLERTIQSQAGAAPHNTLGVQFQTFLSLHRRIESVLTILQQEM